MSYDKESLLAGISLGTQLKGWANCGKLSDITVYPQQTTFVESPADGFYGIGSVTVEGDDDLIPENIKYGVTIFGVDGSYAPSDPKLISKNVSITENGKYQYKPPSGHVGFREMVVDVNVPTEIVTEVIDAVLQPGRIVTPGVEDQHITPDDGYNALSSVYVEGDENLLPENIRDGIEIFGVQGTYDNTEVVDATLQDKNVMPGTTSQTITSDEGYDGLSSVYVLGDQDLIASNIREGVEIFGVKGTYSSEQKYQNKKVVPTRRGFVVTADSEYNALASVEVEGDDNLTANKIADGVTIFGVKGTYVSPMKPITIVPGTDPQYIEPADGFYGFSSIEVLSTNTTGEYNDGFSAGAASRDDEVDSLLARIQELTIELTSAYESGYNNGYNDGAYEMAASYRNFDKEEF